MDTLTFYRQQRFDGGIRNGVEVNGVPLLQHYECGDSEEENPALEWFIDIRIEGSGLPTEPEAVRSWLAEVGDGISSVLEDAAVRLHVGLEDRSMPDITVGQNVLPDATIKVAVSCTARTTGQRISAIIRDLMAKWTFHVQQLEEETTVKHV